MIVCIKIGFLDVIFLPASLEVSKVKCSHFLMARKRDFLSSTKPKPLAQL